MEMTHYMELLATNQPWNLLIFMAVPVICAETIAICELYTVRNQHCPTWVRNLSAYAGIITGLYMIPVAYYIVTHAIVPLTMTHMWRGLGDVIAVTSYALSGVILMGIGALNAISLTSMNRPKHAESIHVLLVALFLVVAHVAMIFGMISPSVFGYSGTMMM